MLRRRFADQSETRSGSSRSEMAVAFGAAFLYKPGFQRQVRYGAPAPSRIEEYDAMAVPKRKTSPSRRGMRRSADALKRPTYVEDKDSGELRRPHHVDLKTGMYRGRQILKPKAAV